MAEATHLLGLPFKHKPKDIKPQGAGSGLDADKVDGLHANELGGGGPHAGSHETGGGDKVHFADLEHDELDVTLHDAFTGAPHVSQVEKDKFHDRLHALNSALDHSGVITDAQHGLRGSGLHNDSHARLHGNEDHEPDFSIVGHTHVQADITDLVHDAVKIKGKTVDDSAIGDGKVLVYRSASDKLQYEAQAGGACLWLDAAPSDWIYPAPTYSDNVKVTGLLGVGGDPVTNKRAYLKGASSDVHLLHLDHETVDYTGTDTKNYGILIDKHTATSDGTTSISSYGIYMTVIHDYGLTGGMAKSTGSIGANIYAKHYGSFSGTSAYGRGALTVGVYGGAEDYGDDTGYGSNTRDVYGLWYNAYAEPTIDKPGGSLTENVYGIRTKASISPILTAGTFTQNIYGLYAEAIGTTHGTSRAYGVYALASGASVNYAFYSGNSPSLRLPKITSVPTDTPDEGTMRFYDDGSARRIYVYIGGAWRYVALS